MDLVLLDAIYHALDPIAFWIGPFAIRWYGLGYIVGILVGGVLFFRLTKRWEIRFTLDAILTLYIASVLGIIIGGRIGYVLIYGAGYFIEHPDQILPFANGGLSGMSFHGGVMGMAIAVLIVSRIYKMPYTSLGDLILVVAPIGIFLVRCANFINGELWGAPTDLPWGVTFESGGGIARHPTQLYEAFLEGMVMFVVLIILARRKPPLPRGSYLGIFFLLYGIFRIAVEFVREPDIQIGYLAGGWLTMGMVLSIPMVLIGVAMLVYAARTRHPQMGLPEPKAALESSPEDESASPQEEDKEVSGDSKGIVSEDDNEVLQKDSSEAEQEDSSEAKQEDDSEVLPEEASNREQPEVNDHAHTSR